MGNTFVPINWPYICSESEIQHTNANQLLDVDDSDIDDHGDVDFDAIADADDEEEFREGEEMSEYEPGVMSESEFESSQRYNNRYCMFMGAYITGIHHLRLRGISNSIDKHIHYTYLDNPQITLSKKGNKHTGDNSALEYVGNKKVYWCKFLSYC